MPWLVEHKPGNALRSGPSRCSADGSCGAWEGTPLHLAMHHDSSLILVCTLALDLHLHLPDVVRGSKSLLDAACPLRSSRPAPSSHVCWPMAAATASRRASRLNIVVITSPRRAAASSHLPESLTFMRCLRATVGPSPLLPSTWLLAGGDVRCETSLRAGESQREPRPRRRRPAQDGAPKSGILSSMVMDLALWAGMRHGGMQPLPMERDDNLWHPGLCWTSSAAGAHLHKFVTSFWRVDRQTAATALLLLAACCFSTNCYGPGPCVELQLLTAKLCSSTWPTAALPRTRSTLLTGSGACPSFCLEARARCKYCQVACACACVCCCCCLLLLAAALLPNSRSPSPSAAG